MPISFRGHRKQYGFIRAARVAHRATADRAGRPHVVPICFARLVSIAHCDSLLGNDVITAYGHAIMGRNVHPKERRE